MVSIDEAVIARLEKDGKRFEILVDPRMAWSLKQGQSVSVQRMLAISEVFTDAKKGAKASQSDVISAFGTDDILEVVRKIVTEGEVQLTSAMIREMNEKKRLKVAEAIHKLSVDPKTGMPHPVDRILAAMDQARVRIDYRLNDEKLIQETINAIKRIIPLSFEKCRLQILVPVSSVGKAYGMIKEMNPVKEEWTSNGDLIAVIEIPKSMKVETISKISNAVHGDCSIKEV